MPLDKERLYEWSGFMAAVQCLRLQPAPPYSAVAGTLTLLEIYRIFAKKIKCFLGQNGCSPVRI
jgi:hypothetical protein